MNSPYKDLLNKAFWKLAVSNKGIFNISDLWEPKFEIKKNENIVTFGSCFAQHIGNSLQHNKFQWLNTELPPNNLSKENSKKFNYGIFSSRTGNIYTSSLLKQWTEWAVKKSPPPPEVWKSNGRFYDPFRPRIEPNGFKSEIEMKKSQAQAIYSFQKSIKKAHYFVFTLGLTEHWVHKNLHYEYPMCPGTAAGEFNRNIHIFKNQQFSETHHHLLDAIRMMQSINPSLKFILTVSPIPLTATKSTNHVLVATMESKSILRAVAGQLANEHSFIDYFPSYEIINSPIFKGLFFEKNDRSVSPFGVEFVMNHFFQCLNNKFNTPLEESNKHITIDNNICDEELLEAFGEKK